ncbi:hypothetical protein AXG93_684s1020 [Marchantia polymorpha subsp. ruderalis]|uniref:Uncharacterized protein n=1 Tax=Marchantia polymorpha subsp. ruderalis TaxID=1480154 RepID=A0A176W753_MARPO|nr:hypothetical protein AXG93_684s1020 [Marchantia polymorpha subsp. ruderalis]
MRIGRGFEDPTSLIKVYQGCSLWNGSLALRPGKSDPNVWGRNIPRTARNNRWPASELQRRSELRVYHPFSLRSELLLGSENQLGNMASYNDVFGDDDTPSWLTATKESEDEVFCFLSVSGTGGLPLFDATVMQSSHPCCGNASFPLCKKSELQTSG